MNKTLLICNPTSRNGRGKKLWSFWTEGLQSAGIDFDMQETQYVGHAIELAKTENAYQTVVAVGGDGTINEVLDGVIQSERTDVKMGVLYSGISPDFCTFHTIPTEPKKALDAFILGNSQLVDVMRINYKNYDGKEIVSHFGCSANIGLGASTARYANKLRRYFGDICGTAISLLYSIWKNPTLELELEIDGTTQTLHKVNNLSIIKNPYIASGLKLNLNVTPSDGKSYIFAIQNKSKWGTIAAFPKYYSGEIISDKDTHLAPCNTVKIKSLPQCEIEFDGDPRGCTPASIKILPKALNIIGGLYE